MSLDSTLKTYGQIGVDVLKNAVAPLDATGRTRASIRFEVDEKGLRFFARQFFELLEKGIGASGKNPSPEMIEFMTAYAKSRGMDNPESAAWAISKKILKEGDLTKKRGGRIVYSDVMKRFGEALAKDLAKDFSKDITKQIKSYFK